MRPSPKPRSGDRMQPRAQALGFLSKTEIKPRGGGRQSIPNVALVIRDLVSSATRGLPSLMLKIRGATTLPRSLHHSSIALSGLVSDFSFTQGLRPGLQSVAASRLSPPSKGPGVSFEAGSQAPEGRKTLNPKCSVRHRRPCSSLETPKTPPETTASDDVPAASLCT
jgi:hypothetical protein